MSNNPMGLTGEVTIRLWDEDGNLKLEKITKNLITNQGDLYYATRGAAGVLPATLLDATKVTGMKLGTGTNAPAKSGTAAANLQLYKSGSNVTFSATYPTVTAVGTNVGYNITYYCSWAPGVATDTALTEAVIVTDAASNSNSAEANTISRVTFGAVNKNVGDTLDISWSHKFLGA